MSLFKKNIIKKCFYHYAVRMIKYYYKHYRKINKINIVIVLIGNLYYILNFIIKR
jgi:hypothetical protein